MGNAAMPPLYFDYAATTPVREEVADAMAACLSEVIGNPSSAHGWGRAARKTLDGARAEISEALGAQPDEIFFVRGGTESDNLAILGWCRSQSASGQAACLAVSAIEHHAVLGAAEAARCEGTRVHSLSVSAGGVVDTEQAKRALAEGPTLLSVMWVNNEVGSVLNVGELVELASEHAGFVHTDAAQALGKIPVDVSRGPVHFLSATGHKIYGPKGSGLLYVRRGTPIAPILHGGGQEGGLRPGTEDVAGAVGLATAVRLAVEEQRSESRRLGELRDRLARALCESVEGIRINAGGAPRAPHVLSVGVEGVLDGSLLVMALDLEGLAVSGGSACASGATKPSHVLRALYGPDDQAASVRFSFGRGTDVSTVDTAARVTAEVVARARAS